MSKISKVLKSVTQFLGLSQEAPTINIPEAKIPDTPAPTAMTDTGASLSLGSANVANQRVSGRSSTAKKRKKTNDLLGGLGQSGLNI